MNHSLSDNIAFKALSRLGDYIMVSFCFLLCCLPLITIIPSCIALYDTVAHCIRGDEGHMFRRFFGTFKKKLLQGILLTVLWGLLGYILAVGYQILCINGETSNLWAAYSIVYLCTLFIPIGTLCWIVALRSRFNYGFLELHKKAFLFTFLYLPHTAIIVAMLIFAIGLFAFLLPLGLILPGALAHAQSIFIEKVFKMQFPEEDQ